MPNTQQSARSNRLMSTLRSPRLWLPVLGILCVSLSAFALLDAKAGFDATSNFTQPLKAIPVNTEIEDSSIRAISTVGDSMIIRAQGGSCSQPSSFEISGDNGENWHLVQGLEDAGLASVLSLDAQRPGYLTATGYDRRTCMPAQTTSLDGGITWSEPTTIGLSYFDANHPSVIVVEDFEYELGCEAQSAASHLDSIAALCSDNTIIASTDLGSSWVDPIDSPYGHSVFYQGEALNVVNARTPHCEGISIQRVETSALTPEGNCYSLTGYFDPSTITATASAHSTFVWVSNHVAFSQDNGKTWK